MEKMFAAFTMVIVMMLGTATTQAQECYQPPVLHMHFKQQASNASEMLHVIAQGWDIASTFREIRSEDATGSNGFHRYIAHESLEATAIEMTAIMYTDPKRFFDMSEDQLTAYWMNEWEMDID